LECVGVREAEDQAAAGVDGPSGDVEQDPPQGAIITPAFSASN
jgi:hypothetical protein